MHRHANTDRALRPHGIALAIAGLMAAAPAWSQTPAPPAAAASGAATGEKQSDKAPEKAPEKKANAPTTEIVMISGTRSSVQGSIARKRNASTVSDSIVAEDIDQFPDKNVGEALSRITGVQLSREFGEGSQVSIRGVEPDLNRIEINGLSVLNTTGTSGIGGSRGAELRELASELISSIDVIKGSTADLTEGGIGGTVRINTRKPLEFTSRTIAGVLSGESASSRGGVQPRVSLLLADKFLDGNLGLMANLTYDDVRTRNDYSRNTSWALLRDWDFSAEKTLTSLDPTAAGVTAPSGCASLTAPASGTTTAATATANLRADCNRQWFDYSPQIARYGVWERDHKRSSAELTAQYRFTPELDAFVSYQVNTQNQRLNDLNYGQNAAFVVGRLASAGTAPVYNATTGVPSTAGTCVAATTTATPPGVVVDGHHVTGYTLGQCLNVAGSGGQGAFTTGARDFKLDIKSQYSSAGFKFKNDQWRVDGLVADTKSDYVSQSNQIVLTQNAPGLVVSLDSQRLPHFTFPAGYDPENSSSYVAAALQFRPSAAFNTERQGKMDFQYALDKGILNRLWFGGQYREAGARQYGGAGYLASGGADLVSTADDINVLGANVTQTFTYDPLYKGTAQRAPDAQAFIASTSANRYLNAAQMTSLIDSVRDRLPGTFFKGYDGVSNIPANWMAPSYAKAVPLFDTSAFNFNSVYEAPGSDGKIYPQIPLFDVKEKISAAYARVDFDTQVGGVEVDGNFGVRYTRTNVQSAGLSSLRVRTANTPGSAVFTDRVASNSVVAIDNTYSDVLPSFNTTAHLLGDKLLGRLGWAKVMARPALNQLAPNIICIVNSGNPQFGGDGTDDCNPTGTPAGNPDLKPYRATKYDFSLEFYPTRDTQLSMALFRTDIKTYVRPAVRLPGVDFFKDGRLFDVTLPINGEGARTQGIELSGRTALTFLPGWASGFGIDANYTRMGFRYAAGNELLNPLDGTILPYPGMSKNAYNLVLWYDQGVVNARVAYNKRDAYYTGTNDVSSNPNFRDATAYVDAKIQFRLSKQLTLSFEGKNLTDQAELTYAGALTRPNELAFSGRRYYASIGYKL